MKTTEFKDSELGPIPKKWEVKRLGDCLTVLRNGFAYDFREQGSYSITRIETIAEGVIDINRVGKCNSCPGDEYLMREGDILYSHINSLQHIGKCAYYSMPGLLYHGMNLLLMRCNKTLTPRFLFALLNTHRMRELARTTAKVAVNQASINTRELKELPILLPPLAEQRRIAEVLGKTDEYIEALKKLIEKRKNVKRGAMQELLTGKRRLPGFEGEWVEKRLGEFLDCLRGVSYDGNRDLSQIETASTIRLLRSNNIYEGRFVDEDYQFVDANCASDIQRLRKNDIMVCMANGSKALVGKSCIFRKDFAQPYTFGVFMGCVRAKSNDTVIDFIYNLMNSDRYWDLISLLLAGSSINNLRPKNILDLIFYFPPTLSEQKAIAKVLSEMDEGIEALEKKLKKVEAIKEGMMQDLLTGKVRLKEDWT